MHVQLINRNSSSSLLFLAAVGDPAAVAMAVAREMIKKIEIY